MSKPSSIRLSLLCTLINRQLIYMVCINRKIFLYARVMFGGSTAGKFGAAVEYRTVVVYKVGG